MLTLTQKIRLNAVNEEFDYSFLLSCLSEYQQPRDKISRLLKNADILRVKKGLYVFGPDYRQKPYSKEVLANLIYGPSYISLESALAFYHLIPERVEILTSITNKRNKVFHSPVGTFTYQYLQTAIYNIGVNLVHLDATHAILIATPEKAIADCLHFKKFKCMKTKNDLRLFLETNLRLDMSCLKTLHKTRLQKIAVTYQDPVINLLLELVL